MPLKLKLNTFQRKSKKPSFNTSQLKEFGKESNISQLRPRLSTIQSETTTFLNLENTFKVDTLNQLKELPTFQVKAELEPKLSTKPDTSQLDKPPTLLDIKEDILLELCKEDIPLEDILLEDTIKEPLIQLEPTWPEEVESDKEKPFIDNQALQDQLPTSPEEAESDNKTIDWLIVFRFHSYIY